MSVHRDINHCVLCVSIPTCSALSVHRDINHCVLCVSILTCSVLSVHRGINHCVLCVSILTCLVLSVHRDINHCILCVSIPTCSPLSVCVCPSPPVQHYQCRSWSALQDINKLLSAYFIPHQTCSALSALGRCLCVVCLSTPTC